ncbi:hypothetical protein [Alkaliphilus hydrothermalis]|uniref:Uncharacterized protein n=1 Tax=Alkaliphilus hydrothermalis TaxID=1482730 RepID=A0ABS2NLL7_9FIRM|nr:hypothetical protein [Alkaliphilus hydrothermalis]MBM7613835.1 hypothetical protein [Alkaliphilus hydrothermalis]
MSIFSFIASEYELPEVENKKVKIITVKEAMRLRMPANKMMPWEKMDPEDKLLIVDNEEDLEELEIKHMPMAQQEENVTWYTNKSFVYTVDFKYTEERGKQLLEYLQANVKEGYELELWHVWFDQKKEIQPQQYHSDDLSLDVIRTMFDTKDMEHSSHGFVKMCK